MPDTDKTAPDTTLDAVDDKTGRHIHLTDYVSAGDEVELWRDPEEEREWQGVRMVYRDDRGWRLRDLTPEEHHARTTRIIERATRA